MIRLLGMVLYLLILLGAMAAERGEAAPKAPKKTVPSQFGVVSVEGASVYRQPTFDAPIMDYLEQGQKIRISKKIYRSKDGIGAFYKVRLRSKVYGYIADVDVVPEYKAGAAVTAGEEGRKSSAGKKVRKKNPRFDEAAANDGKPLEPIYLTRYLGLSIGRADYAEDIDGKTKSAETLIFGLKMSGPGALLSEMPLDLNLLFSFSPPDYYDKIAPGPHSGFFLLGDVSLLLPFMDWPSGLVYYGVGGMFTYTKYDLTIGNTPVDSQELRVGVVGSVGTAYRLSPKFLVRGEAKYYWEKNTYLGFFFAVQTVY